MRTYSSILLLSLLTLSLPVTSQLLAYGSTGQLQSATFNRLLATQTQQDGNPKPHSGRGPKPFFQSQDNLTNQSII